MSVARSLHLRTPLIRLAKLRGYDRLAAELVAARGLANADRLRQFGDHAQQCAVRIGTVRDNPYDVRGEHRQRQIGRPSSVIWCSVSTACSKLALSLMV